MGIENLKDETTERIELRLSKKDQVVLESISTMLDIPKSEVVRLSILSLRETMKESLCATLQLMKG